MSWDPLSLFSTCNIQHAIVLFSGIQGRLFSGFHFVLLFPTRMPEELLSFTIIVKNLTSPCTFVNNFVPVLGVMVCPLIFYTILPQIQENPCARFPSMLSSLQLHSSAFLFLSAFMEKFSNLSSSWITWIYRASILFLTLSLIKFAQEMFWNKILI